MEKKKNNISIILIILFIAILFILAFLLYLLNGINKISKKLSFEETIIAMDKKVKEDCNNKNIKKSNSKARDIIYHYTINKGLSSPKIDINIDLVDGEIFVDSKCFTTFRLYDDKYEAVKEDPNKDFVISKKNDIKLSTLTSKILDNKYIDSPVTKPGYVLSDDLESNLVRTKDATGDIYYFRGNVTNNYVSFGKNPISTWYSKETGYTDKECEGCIEIKKGSPMIFRITRINSNGTIRLVLNHSLTNIAFNKEKDYNGFEYYDNSNTINKYLSNWYKEVVSMNDAFTMYLESGKFCNGAFGDITKGYNLSFSCASYSGKNSPYYSGGLETTIGILSADEVGFAGLKFNLKDTNNNYYLDNGDQSWTMTFSHATKGDNNFITYGSKFNTKLISEESSVRPVINIKADTIVTGNGTKENPYLIDIN